MSVDYIMILFAIFGLCLLYVFTLIALFYTLPFRNFELPSRIPAQLSEIILQLDERTHNKYSFIQEATNYLLSRHKGHRLTGMLHPKLAYEYHISKLLLRDGFLHTHHLHYLLFVMLANSSKFSSQEIRKKTTFLNGSLHSYVQTHIAGQWYDIDLWAVSMGMPLGKHAWGLR